MTFGQRLRTLRQEQGYKQGELAEKIGIDQNLLSRYELDVFQPTLSRLEWICGALEITATELLGF